MSSNDIDLSKFGFVPFPRQLWRHDILGSQIAFSVYAQLLYRARFSKGPRPQRAPGHDVEIACDVGQCVFGRKDLATKLSTTERSIRTATKKLQKWGLITVQTTKVGSVATMHGYKEFWEDAASDRPSVPPADSEPEAENMTKQRTKQVAPNGNTTTPMQYVESDQDQGQGRAEGNDCAFRRAREHQALAARAHLIQQRWNAMGGRDASEAYILEGLRHPAADLALEELESLLGDSCESPQWESDLPHANESLWAWCKRRTGVWLGSEHDYRFD